MNSLINQPEIYTAPRENPKWSLLYQTCDTFRLSKSHFQGVTYIRERTVDQMHEYNRTDTVQDCTVV